jgi:hypothetical protein
MTEAVSLLHLSETVQVSAQALVRKCSLFTDDPCLAGAPYALKSSVFVADLRQFVSGLDGEAVSITKEDFRGLWLLCEGFGFRAFQAPLLASGHSFFAGATLYGAFFVETITFTVNGAALECEVAKAVALSPAVREWL